MPGLPPPPPPPAIVSPHQPLRSGLWINGLGDQRHLLRLQKPNSSCGEGGHLCPARGEGGALTARPLPRVGLTPLTAQKGPGPAFPRGGAPGSGGELGRRGRELTPGRVPRVVTIQAHSLGSCGAAEPSLGPSCLACHVLPPSAQLHPLLPPGFKAALSLPPHLEQS